MIFNIFHWLNYFCCTPLVPINERPAERGARLLPTLFQFLFVHRFDLLEIALRNTKQFVEVYFAWILAEQMSVQYVNGG